MGISKDFTKYRSQEVRNDVKSFGEIKLRIFEKYSHLYKDLIVHSAAGMFYIQFTKSEFVSSDRTSLRYSAPQYIVATS